MARLMRIYRRSYLYNIDADAMRARSYMHMCVWVFLSLSLARDVCVCLSLCMWEQWVWIYMRLFRNGSIRYLLFCAFCLLHYVSLFTLFLTLSFTVFLLLSPVLIIIVCRCRCRCCRYFLYSVQFHSISFAPIDFTIIK